jgi:uncharacterized protein YlxP (DUF503 family)
MPTISLVLEVRLDGCASAKSRRTQAEAILGKLRKHFNVAVADLTLNLDGGGDLAALGFAAVGRTRREARETLDRVADAVAAHPRAEILKALFQEL